MDPCTYVYLLITTVLVNSAMQPILLTDPSFLLTDPSFLLTADWRDASQLLHAVASYLLQTGFRFRPADVHFSQDHCYPLAYIS